MKLSDCLPRTDWFGIGVGVVMMFVGAVLTVTWIGAIIGVPLFLASIQLFADAKTLRGTPCAP